MEVSVEHGGGRGEGGSALVRLRGGRGAHGLHPRGVHVGAGGGQAEAHLRVALLDGAARAAQLLGGGGGEGGVVERPLQRAGRGQRRPALHRHDALGAAVAQPRAERHLARAHDVVVAEHRLLHGGPRRVVQRQRRQQVELEVEPFDGVQPVEVASAEGGEAIVRQVQRLDERQRLHQARGQRAQLVVRQVHQLQVAQAGEQVARQGGELVVVQLHLLQGGQVGKQARRKRLQLVNGQVDSLHLGQPRENVARQRRQAVFVEREVLDVLQAGEGPGGQGGDLVVGERQHLELDEPHEGVGGQRGEAVVVQEQVVQLVQRGEEARRQRGEVVVGQVEQLELDEIVEGALLDVDEARAVQLQLLEFVAKPFLRRMHLVVTAIREFIQAVETYRKISHLSKEDREYLVQLQLQIGSTDDLKCLFVLLLHQFNPNLQSRQYLKDLIITNHMLLLLLENVGKLPGYRGNIDIMEHIKQFASVEVMHQYGLLLEDFQNNGEFTNDCVFTMMHHIGGDLEQVASLFQPNILKTFSKIWETDYEVCDDWSDLIEYVIHKFIDKPLQYAPAQPLQFSPMLCDALEPVPCLSDSNSLRWSKEELENLHWFYAQSAKVPDPVGRVRDLYLENGITNKTRIGIIHQLFSQNIVNRDQYEEMTKKEMMNPIESQNEATLIFGDTKISNAVLTTVINRENGLHEVDISNRSIDHVAVLRDQMLREKKGKVLMWLQKFLIEACYVKLNMDKLLSPPKKLITMEPVPHHYTLMNQSIPVVPWNSDQKKSLLYQPFMLLLHKLGFHLPADSGKVYVRIPNFWTPDVLFNIAQKLGPISRASLKFDEKLVKKNFMANNDSSPVLSCHVNGNQFAVQQITHSSPVIRSTPLPNSTSNWLQIVMQSKVSASSLPQRPITPPSQSVPVDFPPKTEADQMCIERGSDCSVCETAEGSVASDLTRMCVSDEEERQELQILSDTIT